MLQRLSQWIEEHSGFVTIAKDQLYKPMPRGVGWAFSLGNLTLMLLLMQIVTGFALAFNYAPTPDHAHASIQYIQKDVLFGNFLRSLHSYTASAIVIVITLHMLRVIIWGAYKHPRQLTWILGVVLLLLVVGFAFTGYLLPWDQRAYWATTVGTAFAKTVPGIGDSLMRLLRGGENVGALTLMRFYTVHTMLLPAILVVLIGLHLFLVRKLGSAGPWKPQPGKGEPFYPHQAYRDVLVAVVAFAAVLWLAYSRPVGLEAVADPTDASYVPLPEWYFLPMYQGLKYLPGSLEFVGVVVLPSLFLLALLLLPWIDRGPSREPRRRVGVLSVVSLLFLAAAILTRIALAAQPKPSANGSVTPVAATASPAQVASGQKIYQAQGCDGCHSIAGKGGQTGPPLNRVGATRDAAWVQAQITDPKKHNPQTTMPSFKLPESDLKALTAYLTTLKGTGK